jgi:hypothetical protein
MCGHILRRAENLLQNVKSAIQKFGELIMAQLA